MKYVFYMVFVTVETVFGMYFHEPSFIEIKPSDDINQMEFGFSMAYQNSGKLAVGAPRADLDGRVYVCNIDVKKNNSFCQKMNIDVEKLTQYSTREYNPNQHYYLGASVVATQDYFLTCAPLWVSSYKTINPDKFKNINSSAYGTCFVYNGTAYRYNGLYEQHIQKSIKNRQAFSGGVGWTILVDKSNDLILISKMFSRGDINYISQSSPLSPARSIIQDRLKYFAMHVSPNQNVGYGLASGIFSILGVKDTFYALSMESNDRINTVVFLQYNNRTNSLVLLKGTEIVHETINAMFGAVLVCEDLNEDGYSELLVGAPAQGNDDDGYEVGALYIFTGGELTTIADADRMRSIIGTKSGSRFGSAIACTDIDGDHYPEVIVSAPYEDFGLGAIYIISGSELNRMLLKEEFAKIITLTQLVSTQRIQSTTLKSFGASLQVIKDIDENGCDELAVGCPESSRVILYRSIPSVKLAVSIQLVGEQVVRIKDENFTVRLEVEVTYPEKLRTVVGKIKLQNSIIGDGVQIADGHATQIIDLSLKKPTYTTDVDVNIEGNEPGSYKFSTVIESESDSIFESRDFNPSWVILNPKTLRSSLEINRRCSGESCLPKLNMTLEWSGSAEYTLGSTKSEVVTIRFKNEGNSSYAQTCAFITVKGARVAETDCINTDGFYKCLLPVPMRRDEEYPMKFKLDMSKSTSKDLALVVDVTFYKSGCSLKNDFTKRDLNVPYKLETEAIVVKGLSHERVITDREVIDTTISSVEDAHEYTIENHGEVLWKATSVIVKWKKYPFIESYKVSLTSTKSNCQEKDAKDEVMFICTFNLEPLASIKVISTMVISEINLEKNLVDSNINVSSNLELYLTEKETKGLSLTTFIEYRKVLSLQQNKLLIILIAILVAVIILAVVAFILYKIGFFNRNTKKKLIEEKKEHEIRKSMRRPLTNLNNTGEQSSSGGQTNSIEVMDAPLNPEINRSSTTDQDNLISTSKVEVH